jgi:hypothetical protein
MQHTALPLDTLHRAMCSQQTEADRDVMHVYLPVCLSVLVAVHAVPSQACTLYACQNQADHLL